jgi:hypothetical protein
MDTLRAWTNTRIDADCKALTGSHENCLFYNCTFDNLRDVTLKNCVLTGSKFVTSDVAKALGFTLTLDCNSFKGVSYSEELFDLLLVLIVTTKGNTAKRRKLLDVVGKERVAEILSMLATLEKQ